MFINPIEILGLQNIEASTLDVSQIKKAKRKLFADIDLSDDGILEYLGLQITKTDCEKAIDELESKEIMEFYCYLSVNKKLNDFLVNGNENIFQNFKQEGIFMLDEFINFINPYFSARFDRSLVKAFRNRDEVFLNTILRTQPLINSINLNGAFKSLSTEIESRIVEIQKITRLIKNAESTYTNKNIESVILTVETVFPTNILNLLPSYFQSQINKIADTLNFLSIAVWEELDSAKTAMQLLELTLSLNTESLSKPTFEKNYSIIKLRHKEQVEQELNAPTLKKWAVMLLEIQQFIPLVESKELDAGIANTKVVNLFSVPELNDLPTFANEIRLQLGYAIGSLSIACWNKQSDIKASLNLINHALQIKLPDSAKTKFEEDKAELIELDKKYKGILICYFCDKNPPYEPSRFIKTIYKETYRTYLPRKVEFSISEVTIPRCKSCKEIHSKGHNKYILIMFCCMVIGAIAGAFKDEHYIWGGIIGLVVGWFAGKSIASEQIKQNGIKDISESTLKSHPLLFDRVKAGWGFSKPTA